jgi:phosphate-selective porin OprO/OprP
VKKRTSDQKEGIVMKRFVAGLLAGSAALALATSAQAGRADSSGTSQQGAGNDAKIQQLEQDIQQLNAQVQDLKRSTADQYSDIQKTQTANAGNGVKVTINNGRPTIAGDGWSFSLRSLVQYDSAYYGQGKLPAGTDFSSGNNFRRARFGFDGTAFGDWAYTFIYDFGGSGTEGSTIASAYLQYNGLGPVHIRAGAFPPPESLDDATSAADLLFLERAQPTDLARSVAGADGRDAASIFYYDDNAFASASYTGGVVGDAANFDEQQAFVGKAAYRFNFDKDVNLVLGADVTDVFKFADAAAGGSSPTPLRLRERPELNVDSEGIRLIDTGSITADSYTEWGLEAAGNVHSLYGQGGYFHYEVNRHQPASLADPSFHGWYLQGSWVLTGESKIYHPELGAYGAPKPAQNFTFDKGGAGAWEIAARYSDLDLNYNSGLAGFATPTGGIRGGDQRIWSAGINWYPNQVLRFMLDFQHVNVSRLSSTGGDLGAVLDDVSLRLQIAI